MSIPSRARFALPCATLIGFVLAPRQASAQETMPLLGERESAIESALNEPTTVEFSARPLTEVVDSLAKRHGIQIQFDDKALAETGIDRATPITRQVRDVKLRSALDLVLRDLGLTSVVLDEVLLITTKYEAAEMLATRVYPVADLFGARDDGVLVGSHTKFSDLVDLITSSIKPDSWDETGGAGTIKEDRKSASLVVLQTDAVQREIARLLDSLRAAGHAQDGTGENEAPSAAMEEGHLQLKVYQLPRNLHVLSASLGHSTPALGAAGPSATAPPVAATSAPREVKTPTGTQPQAPNFEDLQRGQREVLKMIESVIEPNTWLSHGGQGVIWAVNDSALVVRQTRDVHRQIGRLLEAISEAHSKPPPGRGMF